KRSVVAEKVARVLDLVGLAGLDERGATLLSGGQMQRLALCRALVYEPDLLLLDEPFSNLDARLREQMRVVLKVLQRRLGVTVLFVTHDQIEALSLSDRIAVMQRGRVEQVGAPRELYERPASAFVRDFLGQTVVLRGVVREPGARGGTITVALDGALAGSTRRGHAGPAAARADEQRAPRRPVASAGSRGARRRACSARSCSASWRSASYSRCCWLCCRAFRWRRRDSPRSTAWTAGAPPSTSPACARPCSTR